MIQPRELIDIVTQPPPAPVPPSSYDRALHVLAHLALYVGALLLLLLVYFIVAECARRWWYPREQRRRRGPIGGP